MFLTSTTNEIIGYDIVKQFNVVKGNTIRTRHIGNDIIAALKSIIGGEITEYTEMLNIAREEAQKRMMESAILIGANGVIGMRFETSTVIAGSAELLCYGTAVVLKKKE